MSEIGSEFWETEHTTSERSYFLSGRTALDFILRDILAEREVGAALLPSYCCHTMIEPFYRNGIPVRFYDVSYTDGSLRADVPMAKGDEIFYRMRYFGYSQTGTDDAGAEQAEWSCVIEDCTHSCLSLKGESHAYADYRFASYRKWTGLTGIAFAEKENGGFTLRKKDKTSSLFEQMRLDAQRKKNDHMEGNSPDRSDYLTVYKQAEELLDEDYLDYRPSMETMEKLLNLDVGYIRRKRMENADYLIRRLKDLPDLQLLLPERLTEDVPLCVPVLVEPSHRDKLRRYLISKEIYCPIHWPRTAMHEDISARAEEMYDRELSLVCDQRYGIDDMEREACEIRNYFYGDT